SPAGMRSDAGIPLLAGDACLLVTRPTPAAISDAIRIRELARVIETPLVRVALNRVEPEKLDRNARDERLATTLGAPVVPVPESPALAQAQQSGHPVRSVAPATRAVTQFETLATAVERAVSS
ncbi:MAG: chromosome partitioning protein ParA, partial [Halovenus sp.]